MVLMKVESSVGLKGYPLVWKTVVTLDNSMVGSKVEKRAG
jgi:hypothetical protein